jgi:hypothetical protein
MLLANVSLGQGNESVIDEVVRNSGLQIESVELNDRTQ